jgi:hypothetical protein
MKLLDSTNCWEGYHESISDFWRHAVAQEALPGFTATHLTSTRRVPSVSSLIGRRRLFLCILRVKPPIWARFSTLRNVAI